MLTRCWQRRSAALREEGRAAEADALARAFQPVLPGMLAHALTTAARSPEVGSGADSLLQASTARCHIRTRPHPSGLSHAPHCEVPEQAPERRRRGRKPCEDRQNCLQCAAL